MHVCMYVCVCVYTYMCIWVSEHFTDNFTHTTECRCEKLSVSYSLLHKGFTNILLTGRGHVVDAMVMSQIKPTDL